MNVQDLGMKLAVVGECMLEINLKPAADQCSKPAYLSYGGDSLNTAVYLSRLGVRVDYVSALGDDSMSDWMIDQWKSEGVGCELVKRFQGEVPGAYMVEVDEHGERSFLYWRKNSPATRIFDDESEAEALFSALHGYSCVYLTGITLALYKEDALERLLSFLKEYREHGGHVVFDGNYRPQLWESPERASEIYKRIYQTTDVALPTIDDELAVFGQDSEDAIVDRVCSYGVPEVILKMGARGCLYADDSERGLVKAKEVQVVDTTAAGDSFNAAYLAARIAGEDVKQAVLHGHSLASTVIQHRGAITPREEFSDSVVSF